MKSLWYLTKKNLKVLLRAKGSVLIVIFAPLLIILILGLSYNTSAKYGLNVGVYSSSFTEEVHSFISLLQEDEFTIAQFDNLENCLDKIKSSKIHTCIDLPPNLKVEGNTPVEVTFHVDPTRINLVWMVQETVKSKFNLKAQEISTSLTQNILTTLTETSTKLSEKKITLESIKEKSTTASSSLGSVKTSLEEIDVSTSAVTFDASVITAIEEAIIKTKGKVDNALDELGEENESESTVVKDLNEAVEDLDTLLNLVNGNATLTVRSLISQLEQEIINSRQKLSAVAERISNSKSGLQSANSVLQESISTIDNLQQGLTEIKNRLDSQQVTEASTIASPLNTKIIKVSEAETYLSSLFPVLLVLVVMFSSLLLGTALVSMEKNSIAFVRNYFVPVKKSAFIMATYLTNIFLTVAGIVIILSVSLFFMPESLSLMPAVALVLFLSASVFSFLGMGLGYLFKSEETAVLASISLGSLLLFLSGVILPIEGIVPWLREFLQFNPFVLTENLIRKIFLFGSSLSELWMELLILFGYALSLFIMILIVESLFHKHLVHHFMKRHRKHHKSEKKNA